MNEMITKSFSKNKAWRLKWRVIEHFWIIMLLFCQKNHCKSYLKEPNESFGVRSRGIKIGYIPGWINLWLFIFSSSIKFLNKATWTLFCNPRFSTVQNQNKRYFMNMLINLISYFHIFLHIIATTTIYIYTRKNINNCMLIFIIYSGYYGS